MLSSRDRLLAGIFALQLLLAAVLGGVFLHSVTTSVTATGQAPGAAVAVADGAVDPGAAVGTTAVAAAVRGVAGRKGVAGHTALGSTTAGSAGVVGGSATAGTTPLAAGAPIKVGAVVTQTGAINFASSAQATKAYFDLVNQQGGVNGHQISLDLRDDQLDATRGKQEAQDLVAEGVFAFTGWSAPNTEATITPFLAQNKIPLIGGYGELSEYQSPYAYAFSADYGHWGFQMGSFLAEQGVKKPGLIYIANGSSATDTGLVNAFKAGFASRGVTLSDSNVVNVDPTKASYDDVVTQFKVDGVDGFDSIVDQTAYNRLLQAQDRQSYHPPTVADPLFLDPTVTQSSSTDGTFVASDYDFVTGGGPAVQLYARTVTAAYGSAAQINYIGEQGWVDAMVFVAAIKAMGTDITRENLLKAVDGLSGKGGFGFTSDLQFGPGVRDVNRCLKFGKVTGGSVTRVSDFRCDTQPAG